MRLLNSCSWLLIPGKEICNQTHTFKAIKCLWYQLQGHLTKPAVLLPASSKLLIRIRNETAGGCRIMLPWKPLQVCGPRNNKPQIFRVCKKKKRKKEERERKQTEINITNQRHCKHFWKENTIALLNVTCQAEHCRGQRNLAKKYTGVCQKKKKVKRKQNQPTKQKTHKH